MQSTDLDAILATLRKHGVASAEVPGVNGALRVVFEPSMAPLPPGDEITPGGWKGPPKLDDLTEGEVP